MLRNHKIFNSISKFVLAVGLITSTVPIMPMESAQEHINTILPGGCYPDGLPKIPKVPTKSTKKSQSYWAGFKKKVKNVMRSIVKFARKNEGFIQGVGVTLAAFATYKLGTRLLMWLFPYVFFRDTIRLGNSTVRANIIQQENHTIRHMASPEQGARQCGAYSLYNGLALVRAHHQPDTNIAEFLQGAAPKVREWYTFLEPQLQPANNNGQKAGATSNQFDRDLGDEMITQLYEHERQQENGALRGVPNNYYLRVFNGLQELQYPVRSFIAPLADAGEAELLNEDAVNERIAAGLRNAQEILRVPVAIFILNNGGVSQATGQATDNNHWITIAVTRENNGNRTYTIADSMNYTPQLYNEGSAARQAIALLEQFYTHAINNNVQ